MRYGTSANCSLTFISCISECLITQVSTDILASTVNTHPHDLHTCCLVWYMRQSNVCVNSACLTVSSWWFYHCFSHQCYFSFEIHFSFSFCNFFSSIIFFIILVISWTIIFVFISFHSNHFYFYII